MTLTPAWAAVIITLVSLVCGALAAWLRLIDKGQETRIGLLEKSVEKMGIEMNLRLTGQHEAHSIEEKAIEARLAIIERTYISRADHAEFRAELLAAVKEVGSAVSRSIDGLHADMMDLVKRVAAVEGRRQ